MKPSKFRNASTFVRAMLAMAAGEDSSYRKPLNLAANLKPSKQPLSQGGIRSSRRRAAKMRAAGFIHVDGLGWREANTTLSRADFYAVADSCMPYYPAP